MKLLKKFYQKKYHDFSNLRISLKILNPTQPIQTDVSNLSTKDR